jgi:cell division protein FtsI (penicillin-binding protein 3)
MTEKTSQAVTQAMLEVVKNEEGTGRRADLPSFPIAMKTGTAGKGATGYNAIVIGFGPVPNSKIAFAIFLEHAGKAEFEGARITRLFLESIQGYI